MKVDLGGGLTPEDGYISLDPRHGRGDWRRRIQDGIPVPDGVLEAVRASHVLEHVPAGQERIDLFNEVWRALEPGGTFEIFVPIVGFTTPDGMGHLLPSWRAWADPTHVSYWWAPESFIYFTKAVANADYGISYWETLAWQLTDSCDARVLMTKPKGET